MATLLDAAGLLRARISDPVRRLQTAPCLEQPLVVRRADIASVTYMSRHVAIVYCPAPVYISNVFNRDFSLHQTRYTAIELRRCHESIYYDIVVK